jgi:hypothetical protein
MSDLPTDLPTVHLNAMLQAQAQMKPTTMANSSDSAILHKAGERSTKVHSVDVDAWLNLGWSRSPVPVVELVAAVAPTVEPEPEIAQSFVAETATEEVIEPEAVVPARRKRAADAIA